MGHSFFKTLRQFRHNGAGRDDRLSCFIPLNSPHGQPHDKAGFAGFRFDFNLTAMTVADDALADRQAETFPEPTPFVVKNGSKICERFSPEMPGPLSLISTTV